MTVGLTCICIVLIGVFFYWRKKHREKQLYELFARRLGLGSLGTHLPPSFPKRASLWEEAM